MYKILLLIASLIILSGIQCKAENYNVVLLKAEKISSDLNVIKDQQKQISNNLTDDSFNYIDDLVKPIGQSIIAGFIFWIIFQVRPQYFRKIKLRSKVEADLLFINSTMGHLIDLAMIHTENPVSLFHAEFTNNQFTKNLFEIGLMNKALNESYLVGPFSNNIVLGEKIFNEVKTIDKKIDRIFNFSDQLSPKEILVLEEIHQEINKYGFSDFNHPYVSADKITGMSFTPRDPSLSYLSNFFFQIYQLRQKLIEILVTSGAENQQILFMKLDYLRSKNQFKKAIKLIKKEIKKTNQTETTYLKWFLFSLLYCVDKDQALILLKEITISTPDFISYRFFIRDILNDQDVVQIIQSNLPADKYQQFLQNEMIEKYHKQVFLNSNTEKLKLVS
jgi:hypothetical protein